MARQRKTINLPAPYLKRISLEPVSVRETDHHRFMREFCDDPKGVIRGP